MKPSLRFQLNKEDIKYWAKNALIFAGPALLVLLASVTQAIPSDYKYAAVVLYVLNVATDLFRKWLAGNGVVTKKKKK